MFCIKCGAQLTENAAFCTNCGSKVEPTAPVQDTYSVQDEQPNTFAQDEQSNTYAQDEQTTYTDAQGEQTTYTDDAQGASTDGYYGQSYQYSDSQQSSYYGSDNSNGYGSGYNSSYSSYGSSYTQPQQPKKKSKKWMIPVFIGAGLLAVGLVFLILAMACVFGHDYKTVSISGVTCSERHECSRCGDSYTTRVSYSVSADHSFSGDYCRYCNERASSYLEDIIYYEGSYNSSLGGYVDTYSFYYNSESYLLYLYYDSDDYTTYLMIEDADDASLIIELDTYSSSIDWNFSLGSYSMTGYVYPSSFSSSTYSLSYTTTNIPSSYRNGIAAVCADMLDALCTGANRYFSYNGYEIDMYDLGFTYY